MTEPTLPGNAPSEGPYSGLLRYIEPALFILLGGAGIADGWRIIATKADTPGGAEAGGWIVLLGALLVAGACIHAGRIVLGSSEAEPPGSEPDALFKPPAIALILLLSYVALITPLGYVLATVLFLAAYLRIFSKYGPLTIAAIAIPFAAASGWLWSTLNMTLPQGPLPWP